jgi:uncharacterized membrane protein
VVHNTVKQTATASEIAMNIPLIGAVLSLLLWIFLAFVVAIPNGWVHVPLVVAVVLLAIGMVQGKKR